MGASRSIMVSIPEDMAQLVEKKVASGEFQDQSEVITEGLRRLAEQESKIEGWLSDEVAASIRNHEPARTIPIAEVRKRIHAHMDRRDQEAILPE